MQQRYRSSSWEGWVLRLGSHLPGKLCTPARAVLPSSASVPYSPMVVSPIYSDCKLPQGDFQLEFIKCTSRLSQGWRMFLWLNHWGLRSPTFSLCFTSGWWIQKHVSRLLTALYGPFSWSSFSKVKLQILCLPCLLNCTVLWWGTVIETFIQLLQGPVLELLETAGLQICFWKCCNSGKCHNCRYTAYRPEAQLQDEIPELIQVTRVLTRIVRSLALLCRTSSSILYSLNQY